MRIMNPISKSFWIARAVGLDNLPRRVLQAWRMRSRRFHQRFNPSRFSDEAFREATGIICDGEHERWRHRCSRFFKIPSPQSLQRLVNRDDWAARVTNVCEQAIAGRYTYFSRFTCELGWPPDFNRDPVNEIGWPKGQPWTAPARSMHPLDDIKLVWEPSRFTLAFLLGRAWTQERSERWAVTFWQMFEAWIEQNPPNLTVAWGCGQETAFRLMAMLFAAFATLDSDAAGDTRLHTLTRLAWQFGRRIEANINYALSQKNNHGISESVGLWTIGLLFPEFPESLRWRQVGRRFLRHEVNRQVYSDGSYVQHSFNYHRVMLDDLLWVLRLSTINDQPTDDLMPAFTRATDWLGQFIDSESGRVPNYGANDGALVLPLSTCDYLDYRPVHQAAHFIAHGRRAWPDGPWDEKLLWLCGDEALVAGVRPVGCGHGFSAESGGYYVLRGPNSWAMNRCHTYRDRPGQADMLHVDLWMYGLNILRDGGTYLYYDKVGHGKWFKSTAAHNTVEVDGEDQMIHGPRFLWFRWTKSRLLLSPAENPQFVMGRHYGYRRLGVIHTRTLIRLGDTWVIVDDLTGKGRHRTTLRWRLLDGAWNSIDSRLWHLPNPSLSIRVHSVAPVELRRAEDEHHEGWESLYYGERLPAATLVTEVEGDLPIRFVTLVSPGKSADFELGDEGLAVVTDAGEELIALPLP